MSYGLRWSLDTVWIGDGVGAMEVPSAQRLKVSSGDTGQTWAGIVAVPGGDTPTAANFNTAISGTVVTNMEAAILANIGQIQGFATGGG